MKRYFTARGLAYAALIAAVYAGLTMAIAPLSYGGMQIRFAEALTVLPFFLPEAVPGLFVGCLLANAGGMAMGATTLLDVVIGPMATLVAALMTRRVKRFWLAPLPPVLVNAVCVGGMLAVTMTPEAVWVSFPVFAGWVAAGQVIACYGCGLPFLLVLKKTRGWLEKGVN